MPFERDEDLIEQLVDRQVLRGGTYLTFARDTVVTSDGIERGRDIVVHPGAVTVVAILPHRQVLLVRQYRHPSGEILLELPAGTLDFIGDGTTEEPLSAAERELFEETGHRAKNWTKIAEFFTAPGFATELMHVYLATDVTPDPSHEGPEEDERLFVEAIGFDEALAMADDGRIRDAKTLVGLYLVDRLAREGKIKELA
jgi:ADP-ribose pyrophosphatase